MKDVNGDKSVYKILVIAGGIIMEILLIRHGESEADLLGVHEGRADFPLTKTGREQAKKMAEYVADYFPPELILTSPLKRAKETATILESQLDCPLLEVDHLMEYNNGVLAGLDKEEAKKTHPLPKGGRPIHVPIQNGESQLDFRHRVDQVYYRIVHDYRQKNRIAVVSHGGFLSNFFKTMLQLPTTTKAVFPTGDTGMHLVEITSENDIIIKFMNSQTHLN